ncbi:hypothetical protein ACQBAR_03785 [Propionibacteriaceae bacterium Y1685]|uniref:hypothetical protein n=1 Tax=Microlunatus sp. Y1700 TaxID=3418487 RepID=UPI003B7C4224
MSDHTFDTGEIKTHRGHVNTQAEAIGTISDALGHDGVGPLEMYGIFVGQIVQRVLESAANSKAESINQLSSVLDSTVGGLDNAITQYELTEQDNIDRGDEVTSAVKSIDLN